MYPGSCAPDIGAAFSWAFAKFGQNWAVFVSMAAILVVIRILDLLLSSVLDGGVDDCSGNLSQQQAAECVARIGGFAVGTLLVTLVMALVSAVVIVGIIQAALKLTRGETPEFSDLWTPTNFWQYILVTIVFWICMFFGFIACLLPGLFVLWIWQFSQYVALDTGPGVGASLGQSYRMVMANKGPAVLTLLIFGIAWSLSYWSYGLVGLFTIPFMGLFMSHMYRQFNRQPVAP